MARRRRYPNNPDRTTVRRVRAIEAVRGDTGAGTPEPDGNSPRRALRPSWLGDVVWAALVFLLSVATMVAFAGTEDAYLGVIYRQADAFGVLICLALAVGVLVRRYIPLPAAVLVAVGSYLTGLLGYGSIGPTVAMLVVVYAAGVYGLFGPGLLAMLIVLLSSLAYSFTAGMPEDPQYQSGMYISLGSSVLAVAGAWAVGLAIRRRRVYTRELEARANRLERTREAEVRAALAEERARIARELHDVVAHHVSVMTVQAAGARRSLRRDPERSEQALSAIETTGRSAMIDMRRIVGVLRLSEIAGEEPAERAPQPEVADLEELRDIISSAGLPIELNVNGEIDQLPTGLAITVFRIVQEALTNIMKHAGPSTARVSIRCGTHQVVVQVIDDGQGDGQTDGQREGQGDDAIERRNRPGHGLLGMRERVALYGGTLHVGPRPGGGFEVRARIPLDPSAV